MLTQILVFKLRSELSENRFTSSLFEAAATWECYYPRMIEKRSNVTQNCKFIQDMSTSVALCNK